MSAIKQLEICFSAGVLTIAGIQMNDRASVEDWHQVLGKPSRIYDGPTRAPVGHRNNQRHMYDDVGVSLNEHHATCMIHEINIFLHLEDEASSPASPFLGHLTVEGIAIDSTTVVAQFVDDCPLALQPHLGHALFIDLPSLSIDIKTRGKTKSSRSSRSRLVAIVSFGFRNRHRN